MNLEQVKQKELGRLEKVELNKEKIRKLQQWRKLKIMLKEKLNENNYYYSNNL